MSNRFARYAAAVLAFNLAVILWGAYVRASGSGAGCGNHWPLCNGVVVPHAPAVATVIEFTHRAMSGLDTLAIAWLVVWAFRAFPRGHLVRMGATLSAVFLVTEALLGAALVKFEQVAQNTSLSRAYWDSGHMVNTLALLGSLTFTLWCSQGGGRLRMSGRALWFAIPALALFVLLAISGVVAALGDTLFPARSLAEGWRQDFEAAASIFLRLRLLHPLLAVATAAWIGFFAASYRRWSLFGLVTLQVAAGAVNLALLAPIWMQLVHLLLADLVWLALIWSCASVLQLSSAAADRRGDERASRLPRLERVGPK